MINSQKITYVDSLKNERGELKIEDVINTLNKSKSVVRLVEAIAPPAVEFFFPFPPNRFSTSMEQTYCFCRESRPIQIVESIPCVKNVCLQIIHGEMVVAVHNIEERDESSPHSSIIFCENSLSNLLYSLRNSGSCYWI